MHVKYFAGCCVLVYFCVAVGAQTTGHGEAGREYSNEFLRDAVSFYRTGNLQEAWSAFSRFVESADRPQDYSEFLRCQRDDRSCPNLGYLGVVASERLPASVLRSFCARVGTGDGSGQCRSLMDLYEGYFAGSSVDDEMPDQQVPLVYLPVARKWLHRRPVVASVVNGDAYMAAVDTGSATVLISFQGEGIVDLSETNQVGPGLLRGYLWDAWPVRVDSLRLGRIELAPTSAYRVNYPNDVIRKTPVLIGMDFLLRHKAVCFDWESRTLHLGRLGPCSAGTAAEQAMLMGGLELELTVRTRTAKTAVGLVDTGADYTYCSRKLAAGGEAWQFSFGAHPALRSECRHERRISERWPLVIGMQTLAQFSAFGWELNPLRVFFVPHVGE